MALLPTIPSFSYVVRAIKECRRWSWHEPCCLVQRGRDRRVERAPSLLLKAINLTIVFSVEWTIGNEMFLTPHKIVMNKSRRVFSAGDLRLQTEKLERPVSYFDEDACIRHT